MLTRGPSLTEQVKAYIKERIVGGDFEDGRIPPELELANELGVSRTTVRDALSRLEIEGAVVRKQGAGTFVNPPGLQIKLRLEEMWSYEAVLEAHGYTPSVQVLKVHEQTPDAQVVETFGLAAGAAVTVVEKLFSEDEAPVILTLNQIPSALIKRDYTEKDLGVPVYVFLADFCNQRLHYYVSEIVPVTATEHVARHLEVAPGTPLISFEETGYSEENEAILKATSFFRDDLLRLRLIRRRVL